MQACFLAKAVREDIVTYTVEHLAPRTLQPGPFAPASALGLVLCDSKYWVLGDSWYWVILGTGRFWVLGGSWYWVMLGTG